MEENSQIYWLDYIIYNNPQGLMRVCSQYGYIGMLAPQSLQDLKVCALEIMEQYGDEGTVAILKSHPEYLIFEELFQNQPRKASLRPRYNNAIGDVSTKVSSFISSQSILNQFIIGLGVFLGTYYIIQQTKL